MRVLRLEQITCACYGLMFVPTIPSAQDMDFPQCTQGQVLRCTSQHTFVTAPLVPHNLLPLSLHRVFVLTLCALM